MNRFCQLGLPIGLHGFLFCVVGSWFHGICCCVLVLASTLSHACLCVVVPLQVVGGILWFHHLFWELRGWSWLVKGSVNAVLSPRLCGCCCSSSFLNCRQCLDCYGFLYLSLLALVAV